MKVNVSSSSEASMLVQGSHILRNSSYCLYAIPFCVNEVEHAAKVHLPHFLRRLIMTYVEILT